MDRIGGHLSADPAGLLCLVAGLRRKLPVEQTAIRACGN